MRTRCLNKARRAFTLIEILIVVVILGILAAIVIPQFTDASEDASISSVKSQLQTIRSQIELFRVQNGGTLPDFATNGWDELVNGDYLQQAPKNPFFSVNAESIDITTTAPAATTASGWYWDGTDMWAVDPNNAEGDTTANYYFDTF